jgi:phosphoribosylformylglycinamidine cyclo-ligase
MIDGKNIQAGDVIIGIESSGPHSNGYSLLRKLYLKNGALPSDKETLSFIADYLMKPTHIYVESILKLLLKEEIKGMVHIKLSTLVLASILHSLWKAQTVICGPWLYLKAIKP